MKLLGLTGLPRSGKDTVADYLRNHHRFIKKSFATPLKEAAAILLDRPVHEAMGERNYNREQVMPEWGFSMRWFLQKLGTECLRDQIRQDFWVHRMKNDLEGFKGRMAGMMKIVVTDVRFENEATMIREMGGTIVQVERPGTEQSEHVSDAGVKLGLTDWILSNRGTMEDLRVQVDAMMKEFDKR